MKPRSLLIAAGLAALLAGGGYILARQGLQTCGWLDRLTGISGCLGSRTFADVSPARRHTALPYDDQGLYVMGADLLTADGWRTGLILLDPVSGEEAGRYQLPMLYGDVQLFAEPGGSRILVTCSLTQKRCGEGETSAFSFERGAPQALTPFPLAETTIRAWPGLPVPDEDAYGFRSLYLAGGTRILAAGRNDGLQLFDSEGQLIAGLEAMQLPVPLISVSPDGMRIASLVERDSGDQIRIWDAQDGRLIAEVKGNPGWQLRGTPFWSADGRMLFAPRASGGVTVIDRFALP